MQKRIGLTACLMTGFLIQAQAQAAPLVDCPASLGPAQQVSCLQIENQILQQQLQNKQLHKSIAKLSGSGKESRHLALPTVLSTYGMTHIQAVLEWTDAEGKPSGSLVVRDGDVIPGGWKVASIQSGSVIVQKGTVTHTLLMSFGATSHSNQGNQSGFNIDDTSRTGTLPPTGTPVTNAPMNRAIP